jgi:hypothetical protein
MCQFFRCRRKILFDVEYMPTYTCTYTKSVFVYEVTVLNQFLLTL